MVKRILKTVLFSYLVMFIVSSFYFYFLVTWYNTSKLNIVVNLEEKRCILADLICFYRGGISSPDDVDFLLDRCNIYYFSCSNHIRYIVIPTSLGDAFWLYMRMYNAVVTEHYPIYSTDELNLVYRENLKLLLKHFNIELHEVSTDAPAAVYFFYYKWFTLRFFSIILTRYFSSRGLLPNKDFRVDDDCRRFVTQSWFYMKWKITVRIIFFEQLPDIIFKTLFSKKK